MANPVQTQTVTVLTHGFQFGFSVGDSAFQQPEAFLDMGQLIVDATGGDGVVASYDKNTGKWVDRKTNQNVAGLISQGKSVVLVSDWVKESDISDSGFSEAAADALFTSLTDLDRISAGVCSEASCTSSVTVAVPWSTAKSFSGLDDGSPTWAEST